MARRPRRTIDKTQTLRERIVNVLRESIIKGTLKPGERVAESELAEKYGISRTPIREAFRQLETEGFLKVIARRGAEVASLTEEDVREFYEVKSLLESYAAKVAAERLTERDIKRLELLNTSMERFAQNGDIKGFFKADNDFHDVFIQKCGNDKLCNIIQNLLQQFQRVRIASFVIKGRMEVSVEQHKDIIKACCDKDSGLVEQLVKRNAEYSAKLLTQRFQKSSVAELRG
ncbi:MAG TPA: GntR family transcriptional regulator [Thermodesulfobacteriota bacterium]|nr:GntR family transcriptional regulator [Thermodesulfobacteriota bacterium]